MAYGLETIGGFLGDLAGRGNAALQQGATYGTVGIVGGAAVGATVGTVGVVTGPGVLAIEPGAAGAGAAIGGAGGLVYGTGKGLIEGTPGWAEGGADMGRWLSEKIEQLTDAQKRAKARQQTVTTTLDQACATCGCSQYANGVQGLPYRGGAHAFMQESGRDPPIQSHHTPPQSISPLDPNLSPAIQMDERDHVRTASFGRSTQAPRLLTQTAMINSGNFMGAVMLDVADIKAKFPGVNGQPGKYDAAIIQMLAYAQCLKSAGLVQ